MAANTKQTGSSVNDDALVNDLQNALSSSTQANANTIAGSSGKESLVKAPSGNPVNADSQLKVAAEKMVARRNLQQHHEETIADCKRLKILAGKVDKVLGSAREWFHSLQARSILGFIDLRDKFLLQFQNLLPQKKTRIECHDIKQGSKETLSALLTRGIRHLCEDCEGMSRQLSLKCNKKHTTIFELERIALSPLRVGGVKIKVGEMTMILFAMAIAIIVAVLDTRGEMAVVVIREMIDIKATMITMDMAVEIAIPHANGTTRENSRRDKSKFCIFHDDYSHDTNRCRDFAELISEAYEQGKLEHLIAQGAVTTANAIILLAESNAPQVPNAADRKAPAVKNIEVKMVSKKESQREIQVINVVEVQGEISVFQISEQIASWQCPAITFTPANLSADLDKPVVVSCRVANTGIVIMKVHVDTGSSVDIMYEQCFSKLPANIKALMKPTAVLLAGFSGESTWPIGQLELHIELVDDRDETIRHKALLNLYIMRNQSRFNMILGRTALRMFGAIPSTIHAMVKFSANKGIGTLTSAEVEAFCAMNTVTKSRGVEGHSVNYE
ncbi:uncharacterized protein [Rutidosis leptorrhynchoides]|uniref:uncharacterized protein n=1 Tax=Rutidosis leptorrhynchoides TaxID=125765 RepID=UPI003A99C0C8